MAITWHTHVVMLSKLLIDKVNRSILNFLIRTFGRTIHDSGGVVTRLMRRTSPEGSIPGVPLRPLRSLSWGRKSRRESLNTSSLPFWSLEMNTRAGPEIGVTCSDRKSGPGVLISDLVPNGLASQSGLHVGDVLLMVNGRQVCKAQ